MGVIVLFFRGGPVEWTTSQHGACVPGIDGDVYVRVHRALDPIHTSQPVEHGVYVGAFKVDGAANMKVEEFFGVIRERIRALEAGVKKG